MVEPLRPDTQLKQSDHSIVSGLFPPSTHMNWGMVACMRKGLSQKSCSAWAMPSTFAILNFQIFLFLLDSPFTFLIETVILHVFIFQHLIFPFSQACPHYPCSEPYFWGNSPANVQPWVFHLDPFLFICQ